MANEPVPVFEVSRTAERLSLGLAILAVALIGISSFFEWRELGIDRRDTETTQAILNQVETLMSELKDAETGQRGFLLTGRLEYLQPYQAAVAAIHPRFDTLHGLMQSRETQTERLDRLRPLIDAKLTELDETINIRQSQGEQPALDIVRSDRGKVLMDQIRGLTGEITATAYRRLLDRSTDAEARANRTWLISIGGSSLLLLLIIAATTLIHRGTNRRHALIQEVRDQERETARAKELLFTTISSIGDAVIATDEIGRVTFLNAVAESLTGWKQADAAGGHLDDVFRIVNEDTRATVESPVAKALREGAIVGLANHTILLAKDGREHPIEDSAAPIRDDNQLIAGVVLVFRDATERRTHEKALERSRQETERQREILQITLSSIGDAVISTDAAGAVTFMNPVAQELTGWTVEQASGKQVEEIFAIVNESTLATVENPLRKALEQGVIVGLSNHTLLIAKDGKNIAIDDSAAPILDHQKKIAGAVLVFRDISQRRLAEKALEESERRFRSVFAQAPVGMVLTDLAGHLIQCNQAFSDITGYPLDELAAIKFLSLTHPDDSAKNHQLFADLLSGQSTSYVIEKRIVRKSGESAWVRASATLLRDNDGRAAQVVGLVENIESRKQIEDEREALLQREAGARHEAEKNAKALARSNQNLQEFAHAASHDLRAPLRTVNGMAMLLARQYRDKLDTGADELLAYITNGVVRMDSLISDLLSFAQATDAPVAAEPVPLEQTVAEAVENLRVSVAESGAVITIKGLPTVIGHKTQLLQVFQNLIGNGIKYRRSERPEIEISAALQNSQWLISVKDNGIGFDPQFSTNIFGAFKRLHGAEYPGNGIGLATCKRIVESYGGEIWAEAEEGRGATFFFTLPMGGEQRKAASEN